MGKQKLTVKAILGDVNNTSELAIIYRKLVANGIVVSTIDYEGVDNDIIAVHHQVKIGDISYPSYMEAPLLVLLHGDYSEK